MNFLMFRFNDLRIFLRFGQLVPVKAEARTSNKPARR
jgi:hypothetical protein